MDKLPENNLGTSENYSRPVPSVNSNSNQVLRDGFDAIAQDFNGVNQEDNLVQDNGDNHLDNFPIGYRFLPTDKELVSVYLLPKINNEILPPNRFHEVYVYDHSPAELTEHYRAQGENAWYFFTERERKYGNGKRPKRAVKESVNESGTWKATGCAKEVTNIGQEQVIGHRRTLVYHIKEGKDGKNVKQPWNMHEYVAIGRSIAANGTNMKLDDCVLCKIYKNNSERSKKKNNDPAHAQYQDQAYAHAQEQTQTQAQAQEQTQTQAQAQEQTQTQAQAQCESPQIGNKKQCLEKSRSKKPIAMSGGLMVPENACNNFNPYGNNKPYVEQPRYVNRGFDQNDSNGSIIKSSHLNVENGYNNPYLNGGFWPYNPSHELNNVDPGQTNYDTGNANYYNNHIPFANVNPSSSAPRLYTSPELLLNMTQFTNANLNYENCTIDHNFYHENTSAVTDAGLVNIMATEEGGLSIEEYDLADSFFADSSGAPSLPPNGNVEQPSHIPEEIREDSSHKYMTFG